MDEIINFLQINDTVYTGGQPEADQFSLLRTLNVKTVINLALPTSEDAIHSHSKQRGILAWPCKLLCFFQI